RLLPGNDASSDRGLSGGQSRHARGSQGKRDRRPAHTGGYRRYAGAFQTGGGASRLAHSRGASPRQRSASGGRVGPLSFASFSPADYLRRAFLLNEGVNPFRGGERCKY